VNPHYPAPVESDNTRLSVSLVESMDSTIGEATSVMGAMITELIRRSLRGGVTQIGDQLTAFVGEKVASSVAERTPAIEQAAAEVAEHTARTAATEVAVEEVQALEKRTQESTRELATQIETVEKKAEVLTTEASRDLGGKIELAEKKAELTVASTARELVGKIEEAEKRVSEVTQAAVNQQVEALLERSRKVTALVKTRLVELEGLAKKLDQKLTEEHSGRNAEVTALKAELRKVVQANEAFGARVAELERPRGLKAFFLWLFGRRKREVKKAG
jgi:chromosome segregation ATPase